MKKLVSLVLAAVLALSSVSAFAAGDYTLAGHTLPSTVDIDLTTKIGQGSAYGDYDSQNNALTISTTGNSATFNAQAKIDMFAVANAWNNYINAGVDYTSALGLTRDDVINAVDISNSRFTVKIVTDDEITHADGVNVQLGWCTNAQTYFEAVPSTSGAQNPNYTHDSVAGKHIYTVTMQPKASKAEFDAYFNEILNNNNSPKRYLYLTISGNTVTGNYNEAYEIASEYIGGISIDLLNGTVYSISFVDNTDTNYVKLVPSNPGPGRPITKPTERPDVEPTEEPTEEPTPVPTIVPVETEEPTETLAPGETAAPTEEPTPVPTVVPEIPVDNTPQTQGTHKGAKLNYEDHHAYIIGYDTEDGNTEVRPHNNITRAEVATIFYRLLEDASREQFLTDENHFSDVDEDDWFNNAVSTIVNAGIFEGYDDGTFGPNKPITRAEFAVIAARFSSHEYDGGPLFTDVVGHWAEDSINRAAITGWINGYEDRSFKPNEFITRAEAITLINRVLYRLIHDEHVHLDGIIDFVDNDLDAWYYDAIVEASNSHDYHREGIGHYETHIELTENIDWDAHE